MGMRCGGITVVENRRGSHDGQFKKNVQDKDEYKKTQFNCVAVQWLWKWLSCSVRWW